MFLFQLDGEPSARRRTVPPPWRPCQGVSTLPSGAWSTCRCHPERSEEPALSAAKEPAPGRALRPSALSLRVMADGRCAIVDYKTGEARTEKQVRAGLAPQLTLEAAILRGGGFPEFPPNPVAARHHRP